ncbi:MAG: hypothetical protein NTX52_13980 [Planctomycetota bacterium]|nr:hypothetical protein [Planctomycetota bacterium]
MKTKKFVFCLLAVVVLGGCFPSLSLLPSLHPLYTDETLTFEEKLIGKWLDGNDIWELKKEGENAYKLRIVEEDKEGLFEAHLVQLLERDPNLLKHEMVQDGNDKNLVLTASTEDLQRFVVMQFASAEDANAEDVFGDAMVFSRHEPLYTDEDVIFDERLIGEWEGKDDGIRILDSIQMGEKAYDIIFTEGDGEEHQVFANLVKIKDITLLGMFFNKSWFEDKDSNGLHLIPDLFMKVEQIEPNLLLRNIDYEDVAKMLDAAASFQVESGAYMFEGTRTVP